MSRKSKSLSVALGIGFLGMLLPIGLSLVITLLTQPSGDVLNVFWENKFKLLPLGLGFGIQVGMYTVLRKGLYRHLHVRTGGATTATSGGVSTAAMIACCAPTGINLLLPLLGATAITSFLGNLTMPFMIAGLVVNGIGVAFMLYVLVKAWRSSPSAQYIASNQGRS